MILNIKKNLKQKIINKQLRKTIRKKANVTPVFSVLNVNWNIDWRFIEKASII